MSSSLTGSSTIWRPDEPGFALSSGVLLLFSVRLGSSVGRGVGKGSVGWFQRAGGKPKAGGANGKGHWNHWPATTYRRPNKGEVG